MSNAEQMAAGRLMYNMSADWLEISASLQQWREIFLVCHNAVYDDTMSC